MGPSLATDTALTQRRQLHCACATVGLREVTHNLLVLFPLLFDLILHVFYLHLQLVDFHLLRLSGVCIYFFDVSRLMSCVSRLISRLPGLISYYWGVFGF